MTAIHELGSEEQKQEWLPPMARCEKVGCFGLTEPEAGSDPGRMATTAVARDGGYVLDGEKKWIGNASFADVAVIWARTEDGQDSRLPRSRATTPATAPTSSPARAPSAPRGRRT